MNNSAKKKYSILISDRNVNVRKLLCREIKTEDYQVYSAGTRSELINWLKNHRDLDLLILDPELINEHDISLLETIIKKDPGFQLVVHSFHDNALHMNSETNIFIEKSANSVERLKTVVAEILSKQDKQ